MSFIVAIAALAFLMFVAYRGFSVILFAPIAALGAVLLTDPQAVLPIYSGLFMDSMVAFIKNYFPVFMLGALFGKVIEMSGFARSIVSAVIKVVGRERAVLSIVVVGALLTYGGVSLFVVVFAVYPFAAEMFRQSDIPKRLIPATIALGAFTFTMDALPGTPQIQNIIPTTFFKTTGMAAPILGTIGGIFILVTGILYLNWRLRTARAAGEGYGKNHINEPEVVAQGKIARPLIAISPLFVVGFANLAFTQWVGPAIYGTGNSEVLLSPGGKVVVQPVSKFLAIWSVEAALVLGILTVALFSWKVLAGKFAEGSKAAISGSLLASLNTASEYGFGAVIAALPGFLIIKDALKSIPNPLVNEAITVTTLAGITGSASGGMSIALAAMSEQFIAAANAANIPLEVLHRVAAMASGGMDTLPHNGAVITLLAVTGLTHIQSYKDIFAITCIKTAAVFVVILTYYLTGLV
ncbi:MAG: GntP family permease [Rhodospirillaceae bacterium]|nr:GntP family permease [Rhodospirillales bacterium]